MELTLEQSIPQDYLPLTNRASTELKTWHVGYYFRQFQEAKEQLGNENLAAQVLEEAIQCDAYGQIVENIVAQKDENDKFIFDVYTRASAQITPIEHEYVANKDVIDSNTGLPMVMSPEHVLLNKAVLSTFTNFRRNLDRRAASLWMGEFLTAGENKRIIWTSPMAGKSEPGFIRDSCGEYGYAYEGKVIDEGSSIRLQVLDARTGYQVKAYEHYILNNSQKIITEDGNQNLPDVDRVMTTVGVSDVLTTEEQIIRGLADSDKATGGRGEVWGLDVELAVKLIDRGFHRRLRDKAALEVARWTVEQIILGTAEEELQSLSRAKFIGAVEAVIEEAKHQVEKERSDFQNKDRIDYSKLNSYTGFSGDFCAVSSDYSQSITINGQDYFRMETGELVKGIKCKGCNYLSLSCGEELKNCRKCKKSLKPPIYDY